ncbi:MAG: spore germination protein-like protein YndE [Anaerocolumna sp.]|jgi:spore germination protein (amino acid permease)/Ger(x)C family germination protein|nr:spore germination protein-like protein YndE [Anaerocolumna sp.]
MFSDNEKISLRQLKRLLVFDLFSVSGIIIPRIATAAAGKDGIIAIILATLYALLYVWIILVLAKNVDGNFLSYSTRYTGKIITFIVGMLFIIKQFVCCVFAARLFSEVINQTLLEDTDPRVIILLLLVASAYAASKGFEVRARIAEILYFIVIVPIFAFLILGLREVDYANLMPLFTNGTFEIIGGGYEVFLTFSILELLLFAAPLIKFKKSDVKRGRRLHHYVSQALVIVSALNILLYVVTLGILGEEETRQKLWSMVTIIQVIKMPGGFIQRQDAIILGIWMLSIFTIISAFMYYIALISKHLFKVPMQNYMLIPYILLIYGASVIPIETEQFFYYFEYYMKYIGIPQSIILPAIVVIIGKLRKVKLNKPAIRSLLLIVTCISAFTLTGCSDKTEIEDRNFIQAMGVDLKDDEINVYYILPDLKVLTEQGSEDPEKLVLKLKGTDFLQVEEEYDLTYNKRLDFSHLKAIVLGKEFIKNPNYMVEFLSYVENNYELGRNTLVFLSETTADDIISLNGDLQGGLGDYLERLYKINLSNTGKKVITVGGLISSMNNKNPVVTVPRLKANKKTIETLGYGLFANNQLLYEVGVEESDYIDILNSNGKNDRIFLTKDYNEISGDDKKDISEYVVKINSITRSVEFNWLNDKPHLTLKIIGTSIIEKGFKDQGQTSQSENAKIIEDIEFICNKIIKNHAEKNLNEIIKQKGIDFLNLYRMTSYKNRKMWLQYENKESKFIADLEYSIDISLKIH